MLRKLSTLLIVLGVGFLAWTAVVWQWNDPFTSLYTRWQQDKLEKQYETLASSYVAPRIPRRASSAKALATIRKEARAYRRDAPTGSAMGRVVVPRLGLNMMLLNGTDSGTLRKGPGRDERTYMPGEGQLVYIAGHRTTFLAPFARIDDLEPGDRVTLYVPYGRFDYDVVGHRIVDSHELSVLRSRGREEVALQACHPRFFASQRYIVYAKPVRVTPVNGSPFAPPA